MNLFRRVDQIVLWLLILATLFVTAMALTGQRILPSGVVAVAACLGLRRLSGALCARLKGRTRNARRQYARHLLDEWFVLPDEAAKAQINALLTRRHALETGERLALLPLPPASTAFDADAVHAVWRQYRGEGRVCLAAFCAEQPQARQWAEKLDGPALRLVDREALERLIMEEHPAVPASFQPERRHVSLAGAWAHIVRHVQPLKAGFYAAAMLGLYLVTGSMAHLAGFGLFLALTMLSLRRRMNA